MPSNTSHDNQFLWIETTKYSTLFRRVLQTYGEDADIRIDKKRYVAADQTVIAALLDEWCTNRSIKRTHNFALQRDGETLFSFHDGPENTLAALSVRAFVDTLVQERIIRCQ